MVCLLFISIGVVGVIDHQDRPKRKHLCIYHIRYYYSTVEMPITSRRRLQRVGRHKPLLRRRRCEIGRPPPAAHTAPPGVIDCTAPRQLAPAGVLWAATGRRPQATATAAGENRDRPGLPGRPRASNTEQLLGSVIDLASCPRCSDRQQWVFNGFSRISGLLFISWVK